ncbi:MAG: hypothetical protein IKX70_02055 [Treponema sp.]|nr:hypothetical protein [Treponema sp.]
MLKILDQLFLNEITEQNIENELEEKNRIVSSVFWKKEQQILYEKQKIYLPDTNISISQAIKIFGIKLSKIAKEFNLHKQVICCQEDNLIVVDLMPSSIRTYIDIEKGIFGIIAPHISTETFDYTEWKNALEFIQDCLKIDLNPLDKEMQIIRDKFYLNAKAAQIVTTNIKTISVSFFEKKKWKYQIDQKCLKSEIIFKTSKNLFYDIEIYHKAFSEDARLLIDLLNKPCEEVIEDKISCRILKADTDKLKKAIKVSFAEIKKICKTTVFQKEIKNEK